MIDSIEKVEEFYEKDNFTILKKSFKTLTWEPDILMRKKEIVEGIIFRKSNNFPIGLVKRVAASYIPSKKLYIYIVFSKNPKHDIVKELKLFGIGIRIIKRNSIGELSKSKPFYKKGKPSKKINTPKKFEKISEHNIPSLRKSSSFVKQKRISEKGVEEKKMPKIDIFISSQQKIDERGIAKDQIDRMRNNLQFSIFPVLVELDSRYSMEESDECIKFNISHCDWFIAILSDEYRPLVEKEIRLAMELKKHSKIFVFQKSSQECVESWKSLLEIFVEIKSIKFIPYINVTDIVGSLERLILQQVAKIHRELKIAFF